MKTEQYLIKMKITKTALMLQWILKKERYNERRISPKYYVISDRSLVSGSELIKGIEGLIRKHRPITGGLSGDGADFNYALIGLNEKPV